MENRGLKNRGLTTPPSLFYGMTTFNANISAWDMSGVNDMTEMFREAWAFNQDPKSLGPAALGGAQSPQRKERTQC
eukprot:2589944-Amphidinium_carterae.1